MKESELQTHPHNTMRFTIQLAHWYGMVDGGEGNTEQLGLAIREAIIKTINQETKWKADILFKVDSQMLYDEFIGYDFS